MAIDLSRHRDFLTKRIEASKKARDSREIKVSERRNIFNADVDYYNKMFPVLSQTSQTVDTSVSIAIERRIAALGKMFHGGQSIGKVISNNGPEYEEKAKELDKLINSQLEGEAHFFETSYEWMKDTDIALCGVIKTNWHEDSQEVTESLVVTADDMMAMQDKNVKVLDAVEVGFNELCQPLAEVKIKYKKSVSAFPKPENVPSYQFLYQVNVRKIEDADFVGQITEYTPIAMEQAIQAGIFKRSAADKASKRPEETWSNSTKEDSSQSDNDNFEVIECYYKLVEEREVRCYTAYLCGDVFLSEPKLNPDVYPEGKEKEPRQWQPFSLLTSAVDPHRLWPKNGMIDRAGQIQHLITATLRQVQSSLALGNNPQAFYDSTKFQNIDEFLNAENMVATLGDPRSVIMWRPAPQIQPWTFQWVESLRGIIELITGITRYNQGTDASSLNKTASGMAMIVGMGNQAIEWTARRYSETGYKHLIERCIYLNSVYGDVEIEDTYQFQTDVGIGVGVKEQTLQLLQALKAEAPQLMQFGLMPLQGLFNLVRKSYEEAGLNNIEQYIKEPVANGIQNGLNPQMPGSAGEQGISDGLGTQAQGISNPGYGRGGLGTPPSRAGEVQGAFGNS